MRAPAMVTAPKRKRRGSRGWKVDAKGRSVTPKPQPRPYASLSTTWLATAQMRRLARDHAAAFRLLLRAHADYRPNKPTTLPRERTCSALRISERTFSAARDMLIAAGLLTLKREAIRPSPGLRGRAAEYALAMRRQGETPPREHGDRHRDGYLKAWADDLRRLAADLADAGLPAWCWIAGQDRDKRGALQRPFDFTAADLAAAAGQKPRTAHAAVAALIAAGEAATLTTGAGRRPPTYRAAGILAHGTDAQPAPAATTTTRGRARSAAAPILLAIESVATDAMPPTSKATPRARPDAAAEAETKRAKRTP